MNPRHVEVIARWVRDRLRVPFVVVGGSAIERRYDVGSKDVDHLIAVGSWKSLDKALESRPEASPLEPTSGTIRGTVAMVGDVRTHVEFISGEPFSGKKDPDDFIDYVLAHRSKEIRGVPYADPAVVFYMRLGPGIESWEYNFESIRRDLKAGVPPNTLDEAVAIGRRFGVGPLLSERVRWVRNRFGLFGNPSATVRKSADI